MASRRCPRCGGALVVAAPPPGLRVYTHCPHCGVPLPVVPDSDPAPLFSWEVYPGLYPSVRPPARPPLLARALPVLLLTVVLTLAATVGVSVVVGAEAIAPTSYSVTVRTVAQGTPGPVPVPAARVLLSDDAGTVGPVYTDSGGYASFPDVPAGGVTLNITALGYLPLSEHLFISPVYTAPPEAPGGIVAPLVPTASPAGAASEVVNYTSYPTLESFATSILGSAALLGTAAAVALAGVVLARRRHPSLLVAGGAGGLVSPVVVGLSPVYVVEPWLLLVSLGTAAAGLLAVLGGLRGVADRSAEIGEPEN